jgi:hypothetical protein
MQGVVVSADETLIHRSPHVRGTDQQGLHFSPTTRLIEGKIGHFSIERTLSG